MLEMNSKAMNAQFEEISAETSDASLKLYIILRLFNFTTLTFASFAPKINRQIVVDMKPTNYIQLLQTLTFNMF